ncbi:MAG: hypothetical protein AAGE01_04610 [Pseudomonadota bacterium]
MLTTLLPIATVLLAATGWIAAARARDALRLEQEASLRTTRELEAAELRAEHWQEAASALLKQLKRLDQESHQQACLETSAELVSRDLERISRHS